MCAQKRISALTIVYGIILLCMVTLGAYCDRHFRDWPTETYAKAR